MKKTSSFLAIAIICALSFTSCKKDYTCTCKDSAGNKKDISLGKLKKKDAKTACDTYNSTYALAGGNCDL